jgi:hypothetical protein
LFNAWGFLAKAYPGWTLDQIKDLTRREMVNWMELHTKRGGM